MTAGRVLFVGTRVGALSAAARLGLEPFALHPKPLDARARSVLAGAARVDPALRHEELVDAARALVGERGVDAVLGLTEAAVLPAARLRANLGLAGTRVETALRCSDKLAMKRAADAAGIPCTQWEEVGSSTDAGGLFERLGRPLVLKLARSSGSRGQVIALELEEARAALAQCRLAERFVEGRELSVELLLADGRTLFANPTEYLVHLHANVVPAELDATTWETAREFAERVVRAMGLERGIAHVELFLTERGALLGELAARAPGGRLMPLIRRAYGFDPWEALLAIELGEHPHLPARAACCAGAWMLHPGEGRVAEVAGLDEAAAVPGIRALRCRVRAGDRVTRREGSGQDVGYIEAQGVNRDAVAEALFRAHAALRFRMEPARARERSN